MRKGTRIRDAVAQSLAAAPVVGVVRTPSWEKAARQARALIAGGLQLIEITYTVPGAIELVRELMAETGPEGPPWIGMGTVTDLQRAEQAVEVRAAFLVTPCISSSVAAVARRSDVMLMMGALTPSEIVSARDLGADIVKVYPLPPVGGAAYLATIRQPLDDVPMLAAGGFGVEEIPAYRRAGASAFGLAAPLLGADEETWRSLIPSALALARGEEPA